MTEPLLRPMLLADLPAVMEIARQSLPQPWSEVVWREELSSPYSLYLVLEEGDVISGNIGVRRVADEAHIMTLVVRPERRRLGFARALIEAALATPALLGVRHVYLEVRPSNIAARALYDSLGFVQTGIRPGYYGFEDALLLTLDLHAPRAEERARRIP